ncbi:unnamed protein product [Didymodactylos carnosus]|uniref:Uncharacterized protein n=1 Tax=Didymodactylos carnosus TaxID=1234261 RepID=A0A815DV61_9BILA|nr:unnamed protein product [Didymodactylos carnosus]CAF4117833.1 unnamed protein product [Didymodactylos carnosus]
MIVQRLNNPNGIQVEIVNASIVNSQAKVLSNYTLIIISKFICNSTTCQLSLNTTNQPNYVVIINTNGTLVTVSLTILNVKDITSTTVTPVLVGEKPPTRSAQLGMGLGISFCAVIIIVEIIFLNILSARSTR